MDSLTQFVGKEVSLFPGDTYAKKAIVKEVGPNGVVFEITEVGGPSCMFKKGEIHFISYAANLHFKLV